MPFPYDKYPWLNFQELNLAYFIEHFREIFQQWNQLYNDLLAWKDATDEELETWKTTVETGISSWESGLIGSLETWKNQTHYDIEDWEANTLSALNAWKVLTTAAFEQIRTEAAASATAAAGSAADADTAMAAALAAQAAAEAAADAISARLTQIDENTAQISALDRSVSLISGNEYSIDLSAATVSRKIINSSGNWTTGSGSTQGAVIKLPVGATKIDVSYVSSAVIAFLKSLDGIETVGTPADFAENYPARIQFTSTGTVSYALDPDCAYMFFYVSNVAGDDVRITAAKCYADFVHQPAMDLTAEQIEFLSEDISLDLSSLDTSKRIINASGNWQTSSGSTAAAVLEIPAGSKTVTVGYKNKGLIAFLEDLTNMPGGGAASFADGYPSRILFSEDGTKMFTIPDNAHYIWFYVTAYSGADLCPASIICSPDLLRIDDLPELNILVIGNSFNQDAMAYTPMILNKMLPNYRITYGVAYYGSAGIDDFISYYNNNTPFTYFNYWEPNSCAWDRQTGITLSDMFALKSWNVVMFQGTSSDVTTDAGITQLISDARNLIRILQSELPDPFSILWNQWMSRPSGSASSSDMYTRIKQATDRAFDELGIADFVPIGTAFQNARSNATLQALGAGGDMLYSDDTHMNAGLPALIAAYTTALKICELVGCSRGAVYGHTWTPTTDSVIAINADGLTHGSPVGVSDSYVRAAQEIAMLAINHPDTVTDCSGIIV